jgi:hypothetical protein
MKKTHVPYLSITGRQCHNHQLALHFCVILGAEMSAELSVGSSVGSSAETRNMVHFSL